MLTPLPYPMGLLIQVAIYTVALLLAAGAGALLHRAWRGRILDWAPTCARCGFDLRVRSGDLPRECPECGRPLVGSVIAGPRRHSVGGMIAGILLLAIAISLVTGNLLGVPTRVNEWLLSRRTLMSIERPLRNEDPRAWRFATDRVRLGRAHSEEIGWLLDFVIDRARRNRQWMPSDEFLIGSLAASASAPEDLAARILDAVLELPGAVRLSASIDEVAPGRPVGIIAHANTVLQAIRVPVDLRITAVTLEDGTPLPLLVPDHTPEGDPVWRRMMNSTVVNAPSTSGEHSVRMRVLLRLGDPDSSLAVDADSTRPSNRGDDATPPGRGTIERAIEGAVTIRVGSRSP